MVYVSACGWLSALDPQDGHINWTLADHDNSRSTPAVAADGTIYWGFGDSLAAISPDGQVIKRWDGLDGNYIFGSSPLIVPDGNIYFDHDGLFALSGDGILKWWIPFGWYSHSSPAIGPDGTLLWEFWAAPTWLRTSPGILSDGKMLILAGNRLVALITATSWQYLPLMEK